LVKRLNPATRLPQTLDAQSIEALDLPHGFNQVYQADETLPVTQAYDGRLGVFEVITMDSALKAMIHQNQAESELAQHAHRNHASIEDDAREKLLSGLTTVDEILRVIHSG